MAAACSDEVTKRLATFDRVYYKLFITKKQHIQMNQATRCSN
jgi:hypothetical protein